MSVSQALDSIARTMGRDSRTYVAACAYAAHGRTRDVLALATTGASTLPRRCR